MNWEDKRVLVTGSSGVIGNVLVKQLDALGAKVLSVDIAPKRKFGDSVEHIQADLSREIPALMCDFSPEIVLHLAATFERTEEVPGYWRANFDNNTLLSHMLLSALSSCQSLKVFVFASSYLIYDPIQYLNVKRIRCLSERDQVAPRNLVGLAKYYTERELDFIQETESNIRNVSARIFRVYGRGSRDIISRWIRSALRGETIEVYGKNNIFDYIYADDVAEGLIKLAEANGAKGIVNLGTGAARSINDVITILESEIPGLEVKELDIQVQNEASCADMTRFRELTGWIPQTSLQQGIRQVIAYERKG